ncbi:ion channel [Marinobacter zhanjiangensis]|uniref:Potassium channel domain-containing protein n=1 Tax=Marinobacter zhanjiangensis TaxID=578215 RepID=A0ABQ3B8L6_9GAMM|nr:ion channel [Marinobacter zhanjiangensis]GGY78711.1 hypothetical protein GCM10007071_27630 [Marinobacter zhanjiangensis]
MDWVLVVFGTLLIATVMVDVFWTTLTTRGAGIFTIGVIAGVRLLVCTCCLTLGRRGPLMTAGPLAVTLMGAVWLAGLWSGWVLVFSGMSASVLDTSTKMPVGLDGYIYYVGFTLSTLGVGDLIPAGSVPRLLTTAASFNGLVLVTLVITYAVPLVGGAVQRREVAFELYLINAARNRDPGLSPSALARDLQSVRRDLLHCTEQRMAYPMLDLYFTRSREFSLAWQLAEAAGQAQACLPSIAADAEEARILRDFLLVTERYLALHGLEAGPLEHRLERLARKDVW